MFIYVPGVTTANPLAATTAPVVVGPDQESGLTVALRWEAGLGQKKR